MAPGNASGRLQRPARNTRGIPTQAFRTSTQSHSWRTSPPTTPSARPDPSAPLPEQVRTLMRLLPHSAVVCTATHGQAPRAMTMSSLTSLSLQPVPLVTFNVRTPSRTLDALAASRRFNIHVLAATPWGAALADNFTRGNAGAEVFAALGEACDVPGDGGAPVIGGEAVLYVLRCRVVDDAPMEGLVKVRDHVIVAGEVVDVIPGSGAEGFALAYGDRKYRQLGDVISND